MIQSLLIPYSILEGVIRFVEHLLGNEGAKIGGYKLHLTEILCIYFIFCCVVGLKVLGLPARRFFSAFFNFLAPITKMGSGL